MGGGRRHTSRIHCVGGNKTEQRTCIPLGPNTSWPDGKRAYDAFLTSQFFASIHRRSSDLSSFVGSKNFTQAIEFIALNLSLTMFPHEKELFKNRARYIK
jgi:hypothetical protein